MRMGTIRSSDNDNERDSADVVAVVVAERKERWRVRVC